MLSIIATVVSIGIVVMGLVQLVLLGRAWTTTDRLEREASHWRREAWRLGLEATTLRQQLQRSPTTLLPEVRTGPEIKTRVTRVSAPVPPIAADTGEQPTLPSDTAPRRPRAPRHPEGA